VFEKADGFANSVLVAFIERINEADKSSSAEHGDGLAEQVLKHGNSSFTPDGLRGLHVVEDAVQIWCLVQQLSDKSSIHAGG